MWRVNLCVQCHFLWLLPLLGRGLNSEVLRATLHPHSLTRDGFKAR